MTWHLHVVAQGWTARRQGYSQRLDLSIPRPIRQHASGKTGLYRTILVEEKPMSLRYDFMPTATAPENQPPAAELEEDRHADLERRFWRNVCLQPPLYGADIEGSLFDRDLKVISHPLTHPFTHPTQTGRIQCQQESCGGLCYVLYGCLSGDRSSRWWHQLRQSLSCHNVLADVRDDSSVCVFPHCRPGTCRSCRAC